MWIATNCGLSRYSVRANSWSHFTQEDGLPENGIYRLAFAPNGDVVVGTESHGLSLASAASAYRTWRNVSGPGSLPSDLINDVLVTRSGAIYAATTNGLACSDDAGSTWRVLRGRDANAKAITYLQYKPSQIKADSRDAADVNEAASPQAPTLPAPLLKEDYVSCLAQDGDGRLWIGYRRDGYEARDSQTLRVLSPQAQEDAAAGPSDDFVRSILPRSTGAASLIGFYGRGTATAIDQLQHTPLPPAPALAGADLPAPSRTASPAELSVLLRQLAQVRLAQPASAPLIAALEDDWSTQGDWRGRYGRYQAVLGAMLSPDDYVWNTGESAVQYHVRIGPHTLPGDSLRYWIHSLYTRTPESLEMPSLFYHSRVARGWDRELGNRRQSEWDDHGEEYPMALDGPHVYASLRVPSGWFVLSLYDFNKDGQLGNNRWRDYRLSVRSRPRDLPLDSIEGFSSWPEAARGRIHDFRGGVWKRFLVRGPRDLTVEVNRNFSFNTILAGLFLDRLEERPAPYFGSAQSWQARQASREQERSRLALALGDPTLAAQRRNRLVPGKDKAETARRLWEALREVEILNPQWHEENSRRYYLALLRWCRRIEGAPAPEAQAAWEPAWEPACLTACLYHLRLYPEWEEKLRQSGLRPARDIELALHWDGASDNQGTGYQVVTKYLSGAFTSASTSGAVP